MDLFEARAKRRMTQWDLRQLTGIHQSKLSLIERGYVSPSDVEKELIAVALGFEVAEIVWNPPDAKEEKEFFHDGQSS